MCIRDRFRDGDLEAFGCLAEKHYDQVLSACTRLASDSDVAQDLVQEAFLAAYEKRGQLRESDRFLSWLTTIAMNLGRSRLRVLARHEGIGATDDERLSTPSGQEHNVERSEGTRVSLAVLNLLEEPNRTTAKLFYIDEMSYKEVAERLVVTVSTVESRLFRVRSLLKDVWYQESVASDRRNLLKRLRELSEKGTSVDDIKIEIGCDLITCVEKNSSANLIAEITDLRGRLPDDLTLPPVRIVDNVDLAPSTYKIHLLEQVESEGTVSGVEQALKEVVSALEQSVLAQSDRFR